MTKSPGFRLLLLALAWAGAAPVMAKTVVVTNATFDAVMATVIGGDQVIMQGSFGSLSLLDQSYGSTVNMDASAATFNATWAIRNVDNLSVTGGKFDFQQLSPTNQRAVAVYGGSNISLDNGEYLTGAIWVQSHLATHWASMCLATNSPT